MPIKRHTKVVLAVALSWGFALPTPVLAADKISMGLVVETLGNPYFACVTGAAKDEAAKLGTVDLTVVGASLGTDLVGMTRMIDDMIQKKVDVLAFNALDPNAMMSTVKKAKDAGLKVLTFSDDTAEPVADHFIGGFPQEGAKQAAKYVARKIGGTGKVAILEGVPGNMSSILRRRGVEEGLKEYPDIQVVGVWAANWDRAQGFQKAQDILTSNPDLKAIVAVNDEMALGALQAVRSAGKEGKVVISGFNGVEQAVKAVYAGELAATVMVFCQEEGKELVHTALSVMKGGDKAAYHVDTGTVMLDTTSLRAVGSMLGAPAAK